MEDELRERRHRFISERFFETTTTETEITEKQRRAFQGAIATCEVRYKKLLEHQNAPKEILGFKDNRDIVTMYLLFRCFEYAKECLRIATIYGLTPLVRCLYEHTLKIHWAMLKPEHCTQMVEVWRYEYLQRHFRKWDKDKQYREDFKQKHNLQEIATLRKEYEQWTGSKTFPKFLAMASDAHFEQVLPDELYSLLSNRAHGSDWEEFHPTNTATQEFNHQMGVGRIFLEISMDAVEDFVMWRKEPNVAEYSKRLLYVE